ncbi:hypothetical protein HPP92_022229 [Vanilla planifolia]|uniref:Uncharacterized protein n=1 Tax=Vanilla planifolia TaxID=51239 RepID=A0A835UD06_VANPL|nr:hypothetical protein HPP92_022229 [Vanilla planifolia]
MGLRCSKTKERAFRWEMGIYGMIVIVGPMEVTRKKRSRLQINNCKEQEHEMDPNMEGLRDPYKDASG